MSNAELEDGIFTSAEYKTNKISLISSDGKEVDIAPKIIQLQLNQSIDAHTMWGSIGIIDVLDTLANFSFCGNEYIRISVDKFSRDNPMERYFRIYKNVDRSKHGNSGSKYVLHFVSVEHINSAVQKISKAYPNSTISAIVSDIWVNQINIRKVAKFENTTGVHNLIIADKRPFEAINWLASRAYTEGGYGFKAFESRDGFNFVSLRTLCRQRAVKTLIYDTKVVNQEPKTSSDIEKNINSIIKMSMVHDYDALRMALTGAYSGQLTRLNLLKQSYKTRAYNALLLQAEGSLMNSHLNTNDLALIRSPQGFDGLYVETSEFDKTQEKANDIDKWLLQGNIHKNLINSMRIKVTIPCDFTLNAGDVVAVKFDKMVAATEEGKELDIYRTGYYLIADASHVLDRGSGYTVLELVSDSYEQQLPTAKNLDALV